VLTRHGAGRYKNDFHRANAVIRSMVVPAVEVIVAGGLEVLLVNLNRLNGPVVNGLGLPLFGAKGERFRSPVGAI